MPHPLRLEFPGAIYHIYSRGNEKYARTTQREIGERFNISHTAVSQSVRRFEARLVKDQTLKQTVEDFLRGMSNVNN